MKIGIFGSRTLNSQENYQFIESEILKAVDNNETNYLLIPGDIKGACNLALRVAKKFLIPATLYFYGHFPSRWAMLKSINKRTSLMVANSDCFLIFHDGKSKGTLWDLKRVKQKKKPYQMFILPKAEEEWGIDIDIDIDIPDIDIEVLL